MKKMKNIRFKLSTFIVLSLSLHFLVAGITYILPLLLTKKSPPAAEVQVVLIEKSELPAEPVQEVAKEKIRQPVQQQIVQTDENQFNNEVTKTRFLSAKNNTVKKETIAKQVGQFKNNSENESIEKQIEKEFQKSANSKSKLFDTGFDVYDKLSQNKAVQKQALKERINKNNKDASATNDHIENTEQSLKTQLNTREYVYYGYHKRIREQLDQWYEAQLKEQIKRALSKGRNLAAVESKRTQLLIILNDKGNLLKVQVLGMSGLRELDDAAIETFKKAAPFPNPPKGMVDPDGTIKVRWDFVLS